MAIHNPEDIYRAAQKLLPEMDETMRKSIEELLQRSRKGEKTDNLIVDVITESARLRKKFREELDLEESTLSIGAQYSPLSGSPQSPFAMKFICPVNQHNYVHYIQNAGEDPGNCPEHKVPLIPFHKKPRGG